MQSLGNVYSSSNSTSWARFSAAFFLIKKPHLIAAFIFSQPTTAFPDRPRSSSKLGIGDCTYGVNWYASSGTLMEAWPPILKSRSKCCISSFSSISWLLMRISSSEKKSSTPLSRFWDQSSKGLRVAGVSVELIFWNPDVDGCGGPRASPTALLLFLVLWGWWELVIIWSCGTKEVLSNWLREFEFTICGCVEYLVARLSLYPEAHKTVTE